MSYYETSPRTVTDFVDQAFRVVAAKKEVSDLSKEIRRHEVEGYTFSLHKGHIQFSGRPQQSRGWPYF